MGTLHKIGKAASELEQEYGRAPSTDEIAEELDMTIEEINDTLQISNSHLSLDQPFTEGESNSLKDVLEDERAQSPDEPVMNESLKEEIERVLSTLTEREAEVITLYFGINRERALTLEEIGERFGLTRERVRQIKEKAIKRLRHATRSKNLRAYVT